MKLNIFFAILICFVSMESWGATKFDLSHPTIESITLTNGHVIQDAESFTEYDYLFHVLEIVLTNGDVFLCDPPKEGARGGGPRGPKGNGEFYCY